MMDGYVSFLDYSMCIKNTVVKILHILESLKNEKIELTYQTLDFGGNNEIVFGQTADRVSVELRSNSVVENMKVGMMTFMFGHRHDFIDESDRRREIVKSEFLSQFFESVLGGQNLPRQS